MTTMMCSRVLGRAIRVAVSVGGFRWRWRERRWRRRRAIPNPGALTFTGYLDVPSVYVFRGIVQEADPKLTLFPQEISVWR